MDEFVEDQIILWYERIEEQLLDIMKILPLAPENRDSFVPPIASLILDACGLLDSIFLQITPKHEVERIEKENRSPNITDWARLYSAIFNLPTLKSILLIHPLEYRSPFKPWESIISGGNYAPLPWWQTYNDLKHNRIAHLRDAKLVVAIDAICALHQIIAVVPELLSAVIGRGWINAAMRSPETLLDDSVTILVESKLFAVSPRKEFPDDIEDFSPDQFEASDRVAQLFGRSYSADASKNPSQ